jgi:hypothetical protein
MSEWSNFHYGIRPQDRPPIVGSTETVRREVQYRGFLVRRTDPNRGHMWTIHDREGNDIAGLGGSFTKLDLAQDAVDRHLVEHEKEKRLFGEITPQNN